MALIPSRRLAATFFCVFLLGAVAGGLVVYDVNSTRLSQFFNRTSDPDSLTARLDKKLAAQYHLDSDEQARIAPLTRELAQNLFQVRQKFAGDVLATIDASHAKIAAQMTPDQRAAYLKDIEVKRQYTAAMLTPTATPAGSAQH
jgi:hypothetical protein